MKRIPKYILLFLIPAILLLIALSIDNMLWVTASPEWDTPAVVHAGNTFWVGPIKSYDTFDKISYLVGYRIVTVWTNMRDIGAALIVGFLVALSMMIKDMVRRQKNLVAYWKSGQGLGDYH